MLTTTIIYEVQEGSAPIRIANNLAGYRLDITVTEADNITPKIFILQREVPTSDPDVYVDTFYSVASASQLESVPETATLDIPFYRVDHISLVFPNPDDLVKYRDQILGLIGKLAKANDAVINLQDATTAAIPANTLARYWGFVSDHAVTDDDLAAKPVDYVFSQIVSKTLYNDAGPAYVYLACRADLPVITTLKLNTVSVAFTPTVRDVTNENGYVTSYRIYLTDGTTAASTIILETV